MPIHAKFADHVRNAAFAAWFNAKARVKGTGREYTVADIDDYLLDHSGETDRRQSTVGDEAGFLSRVYELVKENPPALQPADRTTLTSDLTRNMVRTFFSVNAQGNSLPKAYFIRHKNRPQLKRVELVLVV